MNSSMQNIESNFDKLKAVVDSAIAKIAKLKDNNKELKAEANELKRLLALSEKKAERMKQELDRLNSSDEKTWQIKEKDIKQKLLTLSAKLSAFEKSYSVES
jgi:cell division protein FtsB